MHIACQAIASGTVEQPRWGMPLAGTSRRRRSSGERSSIAASVSTQFLARLWITRCTCSTRGAHFGIVRATPQRALAPRTILLSPSQNQFDEDWPHLLPAFCCSSCSSSLEETPQAPQLLFDPMPLTRRVSLSPQTILWVVWGLGFSVSEGFQRFVK